VVLAWSLGLVLQLQTAAAPPPRAAATPTIQIQAVRTAAGITLDGNPSEAAWQSAIPFSNFIQSEPKEGAPATMATEAYVLYDNGAIYVAARLHDPAPDSVVAQLARRDSRTTADRFTLFLDPYHDGRTGVYFGVSAGGTLYDGTLFNDEWDDDSWDAVWQAKVKRTPDGWTVEMRIPYSELRFQAADQSTWGIDFKREIARRNEVDWAVYRPRGGSGFVSRFPSLVGLQGVKPPRRLGIRPYVAATAGLVHTTPGDPFNDGSYADVSAGADLQAGFGSNVTLDATINPDFGQVEVDPAVVNLSDAETFYPEKRPFFLEGANIFDFGYGGANNFWGFNFGAPDFFYSRRIGRAPAGSMPDATYVDVPGVTRILGAAKLTGKLGPAWRFGTLHSLTSREYGSYAQGPVVGRAEVEPLAYSGLNRVQREFHTGAQGLGFISTLVVRQFNDDRLRSEFNSGAFGLGMDGWTFLDRARMWVVTGWVGSSLVHGSTQRMTSLQESAPHYFGRPDARSVELDTLATSMTGFAGRVSVNKQRGGWKFNSALGVISPGYEVNDLGFQSNANVINGHVEGGYWWNTPSRWFRNVRLDGATFRSLDFDGNTTWAGAMTFTNLTFNNYWWLFTRIGRRFDALSIRRSRGGPAMLLPAGWDLGLEVGTDDRKSVIFNASLNSTLAEQGDETTWGASLGVEWKPSSRVNVIFSPAYEQSLLGAQYVTTAVDPAATATYGSRYVFGVVQQRTLSASLRLNWIFAPNLSLELFAQPLIGTGLYSDYKELARPRTNQFNHYDQTGTITRTPQAGGADLITIDPSGNGTEPAFSFDSPDFTLASLRGNAVLRWEFRPGSTFFFVWTRTTDQQGYSGEFTPTSSLGSLLSGTADNVFAVKFSYWWSP